MKIPTKETYVEFQGSPLKISCYRDVLLNRIIIYECDEKKKKISDQPVYFFVFKHYGYIYILPIPFDKNKKYKGFITEIDHGYESSTITDDIKSRIWLKPLSNSLNSK